MGQEIRLEQFHATDFARFRQHLADETECLEHCFRAGQFSNAGFVIGFELEAWLVGRNCFPLPNNERFLRQLGNPLVVPELSQFNVEINGTPLPLRGKPFSAIAEELLTTWQACVRVADGLEAMPAMIGILPTVREADLSLANISPLHRYKALNAEIIKHRLCQPLRLKIEGEDRLVLTHEDVMLEAATTSFQVHLQVPGDQVLRHFNASQLIAAATVAVSANSPLLFGRRLWDETRIPLFEQAVDTCGESRVTFGAGYLLESPIESFFDNQQRFPVLLPVDLGENLNQFSHLRLHNGTIWRWNRLLAGQDTSAIPSLRIEHRVMPAGPTIADMMANAAFYVGAAHGLAMQDPPPESRLPFQETRANFYRAARAGLGAEAVWLDGRTKPMRELVLEELLPLAESGLRRLQIDEAEIAAHLGIVRERVASGQNGADWQKQYIARHGLDCPKLTAAYCQRQQSGLPVQQWTV